jgi:hypothetical protein
MDDEFPKIDFTDRPNGIQVRCGDVRQGSYGEKVMSIPDEQSYFVRYPLKLQGRQYEGASYNGEYLY